MNNPKRLSAKRGGRSLQRMVRHHGQTQAIINEIYRACEILGGDFLLLSAIGSWGDTLPDADVLANLRGWNRDHDPNTPDQGRRASDSKQP